MGGAPHPSSTGSLRCDDAPMRRLVLLVFLLVALTAPAAAVAAERTVSVSASVERQVPNDAAEVHFSVSKERGGRAAALRIVAARVQAVIGASQRIAGVGAGDVTTGSISVRRVERGNRPVYRASEGVTVVTHQPEGAGELVAAGVAAGATSTRGPRFFVGDQEAAYNAALVEALEKARTKAGLLAAAAGATLGPAITIVEGGGVTAFSAPNATEVTGKDAPAPPVKPGKSTVEATVAATFALE